MKTLRLVLLLVATACGVTGSLPTTSTATCTQDSECTIPYCPNQCGGGQPCGAPRAYGVQEAKDSCPCIDTPTESWCHPTEACPAIACPFFGGPAMAVCLAGKCQAVFTDGGAVR